jgi:DNA-directed RNA polymerase subunit RPC12/RpoP|tara:strand:+ start:1168 stop:1866 length:699 start_codon:yes stop_codon:yes gene_type:complete
MDNIVKIEINENTSKVSVECPHCNAENTIEAKIYSEKNGGKFHHGVHYGIDCEQCKEEVVFHTSNKEKQPSNTLVAGKRASFGISGIKCDREGCGFADMTVPFSDYPKWLDEACPSCGDPLLTKEHLQEVEAMIMTTEILNNIDDEALKEIGELARNLKPEETRALIASLPQGIQDAFNREGLIDKALSDIDSVDVVDNSNSDSSSNADTGSVSIDTSSASTSFTDGGAGGF